MVKRTFLSKTNTIFKGSEDNFGLNPICMLNYGKTVSRVLLDFNIDEIREMYKDYYTEGLLTHTLHMKNCGNIEPHKFKEEMMSTGENQLKKRATSFTIIVFKLNDRWDAGSGFDNSSDVWLIGDTSVSEEGSNWFQSYNGKEWKEEGVYSNRTLALEYDKFSKGEDSIIVARQHFDYGNEDLCIDITKAIHDIIFSNEKFYGLGLAFSPLLESTERDKTQYVGFFSNHTNTFFEPCIETRCTEAIVDNRYTFSLDKTNKLYFYSIVGDEYVNLDELPKCTINDEEYTVKQAGKGIYYTELRLSSKEYEPETILYDIWSNIKINGDEMGEVEMQFTTMSKQTHFKFGEPVFEPIKLSAVLSGINDSERLNRGEKRIVRVILNRAYNSSTYELSDKAYYRLYVMDGKREIDVIDWDFIDVTGVYNTFSVDTNMLVPKEYHVDLKVKIGLETKVMKDVLKFSVVNNANDFKL